MVTRLPAFSDRLAQLARSASTAFRRAARASLSFFKLRYWALASSAASRASRNLADKASLCSDKSSPPECVSKLASAAATCLSNSAASVERRATRSSRLVFCADARAISVSYCAIAAWAARSARSKSGKALRAFRAEVSAFWRASRAASNAALAFSTSCSAAAISVESSATRFCCFNLIAADVSTPAAIVKPSQRTTSPRGLTRRWPGFSVLAFFAISSTDATPICERRACSSAGAVMKFVIGSTPDGRSWVGTSAPSQRKPAAPPMAASKSSPNTAARACSYPALACTLSRAGVQFAEVERRNTFSKADLSAVSFCAACRTTESCSRAVRSASSACVRSALRLCSVARAVSSAFKASAAAVEKRFALPKLSVSNPESLSSVCSSSMRTRLRLCWAWVSSRSAASRRAA